MRFRDIEAEYKALEEQKVEVQEASLDVRDQEMVRADDNYRFWLQT